MEFIISFIVIDSFDFRRYILLEGLKRIPIFDYNSNSIMIWC